MLNNLWDVRYERWMDILKFLKGKSIIIQNILPAILHA